MYIYTLRCSSFPQVPEGQGLRQGDAGQGGVLAEGARRRDAVPRGARAAVGGGHVLLGPASEAGAAQPDLRRPGAFVMLSFVCGGCVADWLMDGCGCCLRL